MNKPSVPTDSTIEMFGVPVLDVTRPRAIELIRDKVENPSDQPATVFFVNAHTLNVASSDRTYGDTLREGDYVFGDGSGVRLAARLRGVRLKDNVNGTDLTPELYQATAENGWRVFLLGGTEGMIDRAAEGAQQRFPGWDIAGQHHGYLSDPTVEEQAIEAINTAKPDLLLVGMGNPIQERWIVKNRDRLSVPVVMAVGGLFTYWSGDLQRAPRIFRKLGVEWLGILLQQPKKAARYLLGNPLFVIRAICDALRSGSAQHPA